MGLSPSQWPHRPSAQEGRRAGFPQADEQRSFVFLYQLLCEVPRERLCPLSPFPFPESWCAGAPPAREPSLRCQPHADATTTLLVLGVGLQLPFSPYRLSLHLMCFRIPWLKGLTVPTVISWTALETGRLRPVPPALSPGFSTSAPGPAPADSEHVQGDSICLRNW